jgi:tetratricopeptide (TPR) repeat protein
MTQVPTAEQHRALLSDCWDLARALPTSGVLDRARRPYRAIRFERKLDAVANDPVGLLEYIRGMARRTSEGLESLVEYNRLDLSVEMLIIDESKIYAPLFTAEDRAAARAKLARQAGQVEDLVRDRAKQLRDEEEARQVRVAMISSRLPKELAELRELSAQTTDPEEAIAINTAILEQAASDVVAFNRLGRAYEAIGLIDQARDAFQKVLNVDPLNQIAGGRLRQLDKTR